MYIYYTFLHISIHTLYLHSDYKQTRPLKQRKQSGREEGRKKGGEKLGEGVFADEEEAAGNHAKRRRRTRPALFPRLHTDTTACDSTHKLASDLHNKIPLIKNSAALKKQNDTRKKQNKKKNTKTEELQMTVGKKKRTNKQKKKTKKPQQQQKEKGSRYSQDCVGIRTLKTTET